MIKKHLRYHLLRHFLLPFLFGLMLFPREVSGLDFDIPQTVTRAKIDLSGAWQFKGKGESEWHTVQLPNLTGRVGTFFFRKTFRLPDDWQRRQVYLIFEGINFSSRFRLNNQYLASQPFGFAANIVRVPRELLHFGVENLLEIELSTELSEHSIPLARALFSPEPLRGIVRNCYLLALPEVALTKFVGTTERIGPRTALLNTRIQIRMTERRYHELIQQGISSQKVFLRRTIRSRGGGRRVIYADRVAFLLPTKMDTVISDVIRLNNVAFWDPLKPTLYDITLDLERPGNTGAGTLIDRYRRVLGFRTLAIKNGSLLLNGQPLLVRGITFVEDSLRWLSPPRARKYLTEIHTLGFNTVSWFLPPPPYVFQLTDSLGLLNLVRLPLWNVPGDILQGEEYAKLAFDLSAAWFPLLVNHPSILALSLGNGYDVQHPASIPFVRSLRQQVPPDADYLITAGIRNQSPGVADLPVDFLTVDLTYRWLLHWESWYSQWLVERPEIPVLFADVYAPFVAPKIDSESVSNYEALQAYYLKEAIAKITSQPAIGYMLSSLFDFCSAYPTSMALYAREHRVFPFGLADLSERPRMAWNMIRDLNLSGGSQFEFERNEARDDGDNIFIFWGLITLIIFLYYFRRDHRLRGNLIRVLVRPFGFRVELKEGRKIPWFNTIIILLGIATTWALLLESVSYYLRRHPLYDFFLSEISLTDAMNQALIKMSWEPQVGILGFTILSVVLIGIIAVYVSVIALLSRRRLKFRNAVTFVVWESSIFLFLLPLAFVFERMVGIAPLRIPLLILFLVFVLWFLYRMLVGLRLIFQIKGWLALFLVVVLPGLFLSLALVIYDQQRAFLAQMEYLIHIWKVRL